MRGGYNYQVVEVMKLHRTMEENGIVKVLLMYLGYFLAQDNISLSLNTAFPYYYYNFRLCAKISPETSDQSHNTPT